MASGTQPWPAMGVAAYGIVSDEAGRVLLIRRSAHAAWRPGLWELPGGKADYGETARQALEREAREETGLTVEVGAPVHVTHFRRDPFWVTSITFACERIAGNVQLGDEHEELDWLGPAEAAERDCTEPARDALEAYVKRAA
jgi:mutator protein MutT